MLIITIFLGFEIVLGLYLGWVYANLYEDWKTFAKQKRTFEYTAKEWYRLQNARKVHIDNKNRKGVIIEL